MQLPDPVAGIDVQADLSIPVNSGRCNQIIVAIVVVVAHTVEVEAEVAVIRWTFDDSDYFGQVIPPPASAIPSAPVRTNPTITRCLTPPISNTCVFQKTE